MIHAAREGARAAAVAADADAARAPSAARAASGLDGSRLAVSVADEGSRVRVSVRYTRPHRRAAGRRLIGDVTVTGTASMRVEP